MNNEIYPRIQDFLTVFRGIFFEAFPWIVIGAVFAGLVQELPSRRAPAVMLALGLAILILTVSPLPLLWSAPIAVATALLVAGLMVLGQPLVDSAVYHLARRRHLSIALSGLLGLVNPMCDCGVIVVMRRLLRKGLPLSCCVAYILAGPIINVLVMATTYQAFLGKETLKDRSGQPLYQMSSWWMMGMRIGLGYVVAVTTAFVVERLHRRYGNALLSPSLQVPSGKPLIELDEYAPEPPGPTLWKRLSNISETALHDFVDVLVLLILGALVAAGIRQVLTPQLIESFSKNYPAVAIVSMIGLAFLITLCSEADAFVAANFDVRPAARLAFLVFGPMFDLKLFFMYTRVFRPRLMWTIVFCIFVQVFTYTLITHYLWEYYAHLSWDKIGGAAAPAQ